MLAHEVPDEVDDRLAVVSLVVVVDAPAGEELAGKGDEEQHDHDDREGVLADEGAHRPDLRRSSAAGASSPRPSACRRRIQPVSATRLPKGSRNPTAGPA